MKTSVDFQTRQAVEQDREALYALHGLTLRKHIAAIWGWDETWQRNHFDEHFAPEQIAVIVVGERTVGYTRVEERNEVTYLFMLTVHPDQQNKGIGRRVMERLTEKADKQAKDTALQVFKINTDARRFYERLGFQVVGETATHFEIGICTWLN